MQQTFSPATNASPSFARHIAAALAGAGAAAIPLAAQAVAIGDASLEYGVGQGELYTLPGIPEITFDRTNGHLKLDTVGSGLIGASLSSWGSVPVSFGFHNGNPGYVVAGVGIGSAPQDAYAPNYGGLTYTGGGTFSGLPQDNGYLGFSFDRNDGRHFGWVEVTVGADNTLIVHGYGYETVAGASAVTGLITAVPEPSSLALAAAGALVVVPAARRRRRSASRN